MTIQDDDTAAPTRPSTADWYTDPSGMPLLRYFDGVNWTDHTAPAPEHAASRAPVGAPSWWGRASASRQKRTIISATTVGAIVLAIAGFSLSHGGESAAPVVASGKVSNLKPFLDAANTQWRHDTSTLPANQVSIGKSAGCYYVEGAGTNVLDGAVACGPIRRASSSDGSVWDTYSYTSAQAYGTSNQVLSNLTPVSQGVPSPVGVLVAANGAVHPTSSDSALAAPPLPSADPDLFQTWAQQGATTTNAVSLNPSESTLITPAGTLTISAIAQVATAPANDGTVDQPTKGYHLWTFSAQWDPTLNKADSDTQTTANTAPAATLTYVNGTTRTDTGMIPADSAANSGGSDNQTFLASVKNGSDAYLDVAVAGQDQQISVTTGKRVDNPVAAGYYVQNREYAAAASSAPTEFDNASTCTGDCPDYDVKFNQSVSNVAVSAYDYATAKWAPPGQEFLEMQFTQSDNNAFGGYGTYKYLVDESGWTATVAGKAYPQILVATSQLGGSSNITLKGANGTFLIPAGTTSVEVNMPTRVTMTAPSGTTGTDQGAPHAPFVAASLDFTATFG
jgi:hypothetical protein